MVSVYPGYILMSGVMQPLLLLPSMVVSGQTESVDGCPSRQPLLASAAVDAIPAGVAAVVVDAGPAPCVEATLRLPGRRMPSLLLPSLVAALASAAVAAVAAGVAAVVVDARPALCVEATLWLPGRRIPSLLLPSLFAALASAAVAAAAVPFLACEAACSGSTVAAVQSVPGQCCALEKFEDNSLCQNSWISSYGVPT